MREILFRGQTRRKGEKVRMDGTPVESNWVYGGIFQGPNRSVIYGYDPIEKHVVYSETVGQFTGMTDKNGKKIFEGDIIRYAPGEEPAVFTCVVKCGEFSADGIESAIHKTNVGFYVEWLDQDGKHILLRKDIGFWAKFREIEVIGNIHDNPELLEEV